MSVMTGLAGAPNVRCACVLLMAGLLVRQFRKPRSLLGRMAYMTLPQHREIMVGAGFRSVEVIEHPKGWMCAMGDKAP